MDYDPDKLLELVREKLAAAKKAAPLVPAIAHAADAFAKLDTALCAGEDLPDDWLQEEGADADDDDDGGADDDSDADEFGVTDAEAEAELKRALGGG